MYDVVIIGAGVVGGLIARKLAEFNLKVCIVEKNSDVAEGATKANSAIVHAGFDAKAGSLKAQLNSRGSEMMKKICQELGVSYINNGSMVLGYDESDRKKLEEILENGTVNGIKGLEIIDGERVRELEPNVSENVAYALLAPTGAIVCPYELAEAAIGNAMDNGAELLLNHKVEQILMHKNKFEIVFKNHLSIQTKIIINAAGVYADRIAGMAGDNSIRIHPRKGEYILMDKNVGQTVKHTMFTVPTKMGKGILVSPTVDGNLLLGPTAEDMEDKENRETSQNGLEKVLDEASRMLKAVPGNQAITSFCGLRAVGNTGDFIINMPRRGFVNVAGIESPGLSASPAIAEYIVELLENNGYSFEKKKDFNPMRESLKSFSKLSDEEKNEIIKDNPSYGRVVCRCENITEGEILRAIRTNPKPVSLDGIKRRTRAQMGRCQGGFCSPYILELLAREQGVSPENITKSGDGSYVLSGRTKEDEQDA